MKKNHIPWQKNEQGFLIGMALVALAGVYVLFSGFIMPMIFAIIITSATYPLYLRINSKFNNENLSSAAMIIILCLALIFPVTYLITVSSTTIFNIYQNNQEMFSSLDFGRLVELKNDLLTYLPFEDKTIALISSEIDKNASILFNKAKDIIIGGSKAFIDNSMATISFIAISLFSMFFFFKDGIKVVEKIKIITPLHDDFDDLLIQELYSLCGILTISVFSVAVLQGFSFGLVTYFMDLNWFFIAIAISITSFIPVVGSLLVWIPLSIYLFIQGQTTNAIIVIVWGGVVNGFIIDNLMRPWIISRICELFNKNTNCDLSDFNPLDNTFLIILSTFGGIFLFGVVGLFLGPIIVALCITIFDLYVLRIKSAETQYELTKEDIEEIENSNKD